MTRRVDLKADAAIKKELRDLRKLIDTTPDVILKRIAYTIETAVRYAREDGIRDWPTLVDEAWQETEILKMELAQTKEAPGRKS
jgi:hypothetical protein